MRLHHHFKHVHFQRGILLSFVSIFCLSMAVLQISEYKILRAQTAPAPSGYEWKQIFGDEFNDTLVDPQKWGKCYYWYSQYYDGCANSTELQYYKGSQVTESGGSLRLTAEKRDVQGWNGTAEQTYNYTSGMVSTVRYNYETYSQVPFATTYGFFEARMKLPAGQGLWPAFWLLEEDQTAPPEIDVMEFLGHDTDTIHMNYHYLDNGHQQNQTAYSGPDFSSGWHTYAVNWEPNKITWYIDGVVRKTFTGSTVTDKPMYLILNLAVGGSWPGNPDMTTPFPATVEVDYVRVYQTQKISATPTPTNNGAASGSTSSPNTSGVQPTSSGPTPPSSQTTPTPGQKDQQTNQSITKTPTTDKQPSITSPQPTVTTTNSDRKKQFAIRITALGILSLIGAVIYFYRHHIHLRKR